MSSRLVTPGYYYRLQLKTAADRYLNVENTGSINASTPNAGNPYSKWLFIPTGDGSSFWILNQGAQGGRGQAFAIPAGQKLAKQWDLIPTDPAQKFVVKASSRFPGYVNLIRKGTNEAVSTRWGQAAFEWGLTPGDDQQCFKLERSDKITAEDTLSGYLYWNYKNPQIADYFNSIGVVPAPKLLNINKLVFYNNSAKEIGVAVHRFGCADVPWRDGKPQCAYKELKPGQEYEFVVSDYLKNSEPIWSLIGISTAAVFSAALIVASAGLAAPVVAPLVGVAAGAAGVTTAAGITASAAATLAATAAIAQASFVVLTASTIPSIVENAQALANPESRTDAVSKFMLDKGIDNPKVQAALTKHLGPTYFFSDGDVFEQHTQSFYLEETMAQKKISEMFYGQGTCFFVIN